MYRVRFAAMALVALFVLATVSHAADKADKKKRNAVAGTVKSVDAAGKKITVAVKVKKETSDKTLSLADDVRVRINGEAKTLGDIEEGSKARLRLSEDGKTVTAINVGKRKKDE